MSFPFPRQRPDKVKQVIIGLHQSQVEYLDPIVQSSGISRSEIIREALNEWIDKNRSALEGARHVDKTYRGED